MKITDETLGIFLVAFRTSREAVWEDRVKDGLEAALAAAEQPVAVKSLEWRVFCSASGNSDAKAFGNEYVVQAEEGGWSMYRPYQDEYYSLHRTIEAAKAAAQADFEARIRSALASPAQPAPPQDSGDNGRLSLVIPKGDTF